MGPITAAEFERAMVSMRNVVRRHTATWPPWLSREDAFSIGSLAVVKAVRYWDRKRGVPFAVFIRARVRGALLDDGRVRHLAGRDSSSYPETGHLSLNYPALNADEPGREVEFGEMIEDPGPGPAEQYETEQAARNLRRRWRTMTEPQRQVIALIFRERVRDGAIPKLGRILGVTVSRLSQLRTQAREHMATDDDDTDAPPD